MQKLLTDRVAVVTGSTHGLGEATARHLASLGANVALLARNQEGLDRVESALQNESGRVLTVSCDAADGEQVLSASGKILDELGRVDILINNIGIAAPIGFKETSFADWDRILGVNLSSAFYMTRALWEALVDSGAGYVINVSGTMGVRGGGSPAYGSTKFGLTGLTRAMANAGKDHNLRATALFPGGMDTGWRGAPIGVKPRRETMDPDEVARFIGYLVSTPVEFVVNEAMLNPIADPFM